MHFCKTTLAKKYYIDLEWERITLQATQAERDLGIIAPNNGKYSLQAQTSSCKSPSSIGNYEEHFSFFNIKFFKILFLTFVGYML